MGQMPRPLCFAAPAARTALKGKDSAKEDYLSPMSACSQIRELSSVTLDQLRNLPIPNTKGRISRLPTFAH